MAARRATSALVAVLLCATSASAGRFIRVLGGATSFAIDQAAHVAYIGNPGEIFTLDLRTSRFVAVSAVSGFTATSVISDFDPATGLLALFGTNSPAFGDFGTYDPRAGSFTPVSGGGNPSSGGAVLVGGLLWAPFTFACFPVTVPFPQQHCAAVVRAFHPAGYPVGFIDLTPAGSGVSVPIQCMARSPDGRRILVGTFDNTVFVLDTPTLQTVHTLNVGGATCPMATDNDQAVVADNHTAGLPDFSQVSIVLLDLDNPRVVPPVRDFRGRVVAGVALDSPHHVAYAITSRSAENGVFDGGTLVTLGVPRLDVRRRQTLPRRLGQLRALAVSPDGHTILVGGEFGVFQITRRRGA
jgi:WD40 repeat protein